MRTAPTTIAAMLAGTTPATLATCVKFVLRDQTEMGFTDLDEDVDVSLASDFDYAVTYSAVDGMVLGDIDYAAGLDADNGEIRIPVGGQITRADMLGRRFNQADVYIFDIDHSLSVPEEFEIFRGTIADAYAQEGMAVFEIRSLTDRYNSVVGSILSPRCGADFGDVRCGKAKDWIAATVTAVESNIKFTTDLLGYADQHFRFGEVDFDSGDLQNSWPMEVIGFTGATGVVELFVPAPVAPQIGDLLRIAAGCSRLKVSDDASVPTCETNDNIPRFRGYDRVPGSDTYLKVAVPNASG